MNFLAVALGGACGAVMRYALVLWAGRAFGATYPYGVFGANVVGSLLMGLLAGWLVGRVDVRIALFLMTGVLGGFTTFSAFSLDAVALWEGGRPAAAITYVVSSVALSIIALIVGLVAGRAL